MQSFPWNGTRVPAFYLSTPAWKYLQPRECFEKGGLSNPAPAILIGGGVRFSFPSPALGECGHRGLARCCVAVQLELMATASALSRSGASTEPRIFAFAAHDGRLSPSITCTAKQSSSPRPQGLENLRASDRDAPRCM